MSVGHQALTKAERVNSIGQQLSNLLAASFGHQDIQLLMTTVFICPLVETVMMEIKQLEIVSRSVKSDEISMTVPCSFTL